MVASVTFGDKNTWTDWQMIPIARPIINPPALKTNIVDIPAANGQIDLMRALVGYPVYKNRTGSFKFRLIEANADTVQARVNAIARYLHGLYKPMVLSEEPQYYYNGYYDVSEVVYAKRGEFADITIRYDVEPYKYAEVVKTGSVSGTDVMLEDIWTWTGSKSVTPHVVISNATGSVTFSVYRSDVESWQTSVYTNGTNQTTGTPLRFNRYSERLRISGTGDYSISFTAGVL